MITENTSLDLDSVKSVKGTYTIQLINEDGTIDKEVVSENAVDVEAYKGLGQRRLQLLTSTSSVSFIDQMKYLALTTGDVPETNSPTFVFGKRVGIASDGATHSPTTGSTNKSMAKVFTNADGTAIVRRRVFEWLPDSCNGTFRSIYVGGLEITNGYRNCNRFTTPCAFGNVGVTAATCGASYIHMATQEADTALAKLRQFSFPAAATTCTKAFEDAGAYATCGSSPAAKDGTVRLPIYGKDLPSTDPLYKLPCYAVYNYKTQELSVKPFVNLDGTTKWTASSTDTAARAWERMHCREDGTSVSAALKVTSSSSAFDSIEFVNFNNEIAVDRFSLNFMDTKDATGRTFGFWNSCSYSTGSGSIYYVSLQNRLIFLTDNHAVLLGSFSEKDTNAQSPDNFAKPTDCTPAMLVIDVTQRKVVKVIDLTHLIPVHADFKPERAATLGISNRHVPSGMVFTIGISPTVNGGSSDTPRALCVDIQLDKDFNIKRTGVMGSGYPVSPNALMVTENGSQVTLGAYTANGTAVDALYYDPVNLPIFSHTLLPEAVTKTDTQSMRITYDIAVTIDPTYGALEARSAFLEQIQEV